MTHSTRHYLAWESVVNTSNTSRVIVLLANTFELGNHR